MECCRREGIAESPQYAWSKELLEADKKRLAGDTARAATSSKVKDLRREAQGLKIVDGLRWTVFGGQSHHLHPLFMTNMMALITRRSSTRALPRTSVGNRGWIEDHRSSLRQKRLGRIVSLRIKHPERISNRFLQQQFYWVLALATIRLRWPVTAEEKPNF